ASWIVSMSRLASRSSLWARITSSSQPSVPVICAATRMRSAPWAEFARTARSTVATICLDLVRKDMIRTPPSNFCDARSPAAHSADGGMVLVFGGVQRKGIRHIRLPGGQRTHTRGGGGRVAHRIGGGRLAGEHKGLASAAAIIDVAPFAIAAGLFHPT